jgi:hypothetical protein
MILRKDRLCHRWLRGPWRCDRQSLGRYRCRCRHFLCRPPGRGNRDGRRAASDGKTELGCRSTSVTLVHRRRSREGGRAFGRLDILVNNAAWNIGIPFPTSMR